MNDVIIISNTEFTANATTQVTATVPANCIYKELYSDDARIKVSMDNVTFSDTVELENGENTVYIQVGDISGQFTEALGYYYFVDENDYGDFYYTITVTGGTVPVFIRKNITLAPRAATVQFSGDTVNSRVSLGTNNTERILDFPINYYVESVAEQGDRAVITGAAFAEKLVHKLIIYRVKYEFKASLLAWERPTIQDHLDAISAEIGVPIVFRGRNFYPKTDMNYLIRRHITALYEQISGNFGEILDRLIGWSDTVPGMTYNLYVFNGTIYIIQQGYEQNTVTLQNVGLRPVLTHTVRRTQWADSKYQSVIPRQISSSDAANSNTPFSGTLTWGNTSLTYTDGYLTQETKGDTTTTYTYTDYDTGKRLTTKTIKEIDPDTQETVTETVTTYTYQNTEKDMYLFEETTTTQEYGVTVASQITRHVPIGGGWYGTTIYDTLDGTEEVISENLSQGAPGQIASQYMIDAQNDALKPAGATRQMTVPLNGVAKARQTYPVADLTTLQAIADALDSYEGAEQVELQAEIVGGTHVYTFNDKITFDGNVYFLVTNNVTQTYNTIRQNITAVRWIK